MLTDDSDARKATPIFNGFLRYFPDAIIAAAHLSWIGSQKHNPGEPLHWSRGRSNDHADALVRHLLALGTIDSDGIPHSVKVFWRAGAIAQLELEQLRKDQMEQEKMTPVLGLAAD